jgi:Zn-dependent protease
VLGSSAHRRPIIEFTPERIYTSLVTYVVLLFSLSCHESAHALAALKLGDDTAEREGRITLNPVPHMDPIGTVLFPLMQMLTSLPFLGWAKPTPYNPANFRRSVSMRTGHMVVAAAGPLSNLLLALAFTAGLWVVIRTVPGVDAAHPLFRIADVGIQLNIVLALFNLVPIPPLDGSKVASYGLSPRLGDRYDRVMGPYGYLILLALLVSGILGLFLGPATHWLSVLLFRLVGVRVF